MHMSINSGTPSVPHVKENENANFSPQLCYMFLLWSTWGVTRAQLAIGGSRESLERLDLYSCTLCPLELSSLRTVWSAGEQVEGHTASALTIMMSYFVHLTPQTNRWCCDLPSYPVPCSIWTKQAYLESRQSCFRLCSYVVDQGAMDLA